jgi:hypothetical protein
MDRNFPGEREASISWDQVRSPTAVMFPPRAQLHSSVFEQKWHILPWHGQVQTQVSTCSLEAGKREVSLPQILMASLLPKSTLAPRHTLSDLGLCYAFHRAGESISKFQSHKRGHAFY